MALATMSAVVPNAAPAVAASAGAADPLTSTSVVITVVTVSPSTPTPSTTPQPLSITVRLTNTTDQNLPTVRLLVDRGNPITTQRALDAAIASPSAPDPSLDAPVGTIDHAPVTAALAPKATTTVTYTTTTDVPTDAALCLCHIAIYPLYLTAHTTDASGADVLLGTAQTYLPAFSTPSYPKVTVSWIWPLIDRPHRLDSSTSFIDDSLGESVSGGRLDQMLQVVELVESQTHNGVGLTLLIDPDMIDELAVMAAGPYRVEQGHKTVAGLYTSAAAAWLVRLRAVLAIPGIGVSSVPFADPDVEALTSNGLSWTSGLGQAEQTRIATALGAPLPTASVGWPADETASPATLTALVRQGASSVLLDDATLPPLQADPAPSALAGVQTRAGALTAFVTSPQVQKYVASVMALGGLGLSALPELIAQIALRAVEDGAQSPYVVVVPPRSLDPIPEVAAQAIEDTAHTFWSTSATLASGASTATTSERGALVPPRASTGLPQPTLDLARRLGAIVPGLTSMLSSTDAVAVLGGLPAGIQRAESTWWRSHQADEATFVSQLARRVDALEAGVRIVKPTNGTYTLASTTSPLPITVENTLAVAVHVQVLVSSVNGLPGFRAQNLGTQTIAPGSSASPTRVTLHIPTHVDRTGRFTVQAVLLTPSDAPVGSPVVLTVRSTALGTIGVVITVVAGGVLAIALLVRFGRRWRRRGMPAPPPVVTT
jgi:hypothetical protein